jgi:RimJ/RimL family protein N-acetyltransferase
VRALISLARPTEHHLDFIFSASRIADISSNTYLPRFTDRAEATHWISVVPHGYVIELPDGPVGFVSVHDEVDLGGAELPLPPGAKEIELWLIPEARGKGFSTEAHERLLETSARDTPLVAIVWENNEDSIRLFHKLGYSTVGHIYWSGPDGEGPCWVGLLSDIQASVSTQK